MRKPNMFRSISAALVIAAAIALTQFAPAPALAATPNVAVGAGQVMVFPFHISGAVSATATSTVRFQMPQPCDAIGFGVNSRAIVGATNTVDLKVGGVSILSGVVTVAAAGTWYEGTITTVPIADEAVVTMDINIVGTSLTDTTFVLTCARK